MTSAIHLVARRHVLATYRLARSQGESPRSAARHARDTAACELADLALGGYKTYGSVHLARYRDARALVDEIDTRCYELPFWQTGKVTFVPVSMIETRYPTCVPCGISWNVNYSTSHCGNCGNPFQMLTAAEWAAAERPAHRITWAAQS